MNYYTLVFKQKYWHNYYEIFQDYCYNFFDESPEKDFSNQQFDAMIKRIALLPLVVIVYYYSFTLISDDDNLKSDGVRRISYQEQFVSFDKIYSFYNREDDLYQANTLNNKSYQHSYFPLSFGFAPHINTMIANNCKSCVMNCTLIV